MKTESKKFFWIAPTLLTAFVLWTVAVCFIDVSPIGPLDSAVGFSTLNGFFHHLTGVNMTLYTVTDWLGLVPIFVALGFAALGLIQWIRRKSILKVDRSILALGVFYIAVMACYMFFEIVVINYRPILIDGCQEASYPSSTTLLVMCVMPTAVMQFRSRIGNAAWKRGITLAIVAFTAFMVIGRLISGVHWITDIIGGALLSAGLVTMYAAVVSYQSGIALRQG